MKFWQCFLFLFPDHFLALPFLWCCSCKHTVARGRYCSTISCCSDNVLVCFNNSTMGHALHLFSTNFSNIGRYLLKSQKNQSDDWNYDSDARVFWKYQLRMSFWGVKYTDGSTETKVGVGFSQSPTPPQLLRNHFWVLSMLGRGCHKHKKRKIFLSGRRSAHKALSMLLKALFSEV